MFNNQNKPRVAFYARVSTDEQTIKNQLLQLELYRQAEGWGEVVVFSDEGISGAKARAQRPGFDAMLTAAEAGEFDLITAWTIDRLGRKPSDLFALADLAEAKGFALYFIKDRISTDTPAGQLFFTILTGIAAFERRMIIDRTKAGLARAKAQGKKLGKAPMPAAKQAKVLAMLANGCSYSNIRGQLGVGNSAITRLARTVSR
jgi:DNA invertase Pin-like site-specific DNA recombinase